MRENLLLLADRGDDPERVREFLVKAENRGGLMMDTLQIAKKKRSWRRLLARRLEQVRATQWAVAEQAAAVLEEYGLLRRD